VVEEITVYRDQPSSGCEPCGHVILCCEGTEGDLEALVDVDHHGVSLSQSQLIQNTRSPVIKAYRLLVMEEAVNLNRSGGAPARIAEAWARVAANGRPGGAEGVVPTPGGVPSTSALFGDSIRSPGE